VVAVLLGFAAALGVAGCGNPIGTVTGKVNYKGSPLKGGEVVFFGANGQSAQSEIKEDGTYTIDKLVAGPAKICVKTSQLKPPAPGTRRFNPVPEGAPGEMKQESPEEKAKRYVAIPEKYEDPKTSGKEYTVKSGKQEFNIDLD
jgi:hypothetical protein